MSSSTSQNENSAFALLDHLLEGCQIIDPNWRYLYVNDAVLEQGRHSRQALLGRSMLEVYPGIEKTSMFAGLRQCMRDRRHRRLENEFTFTDGTKRWFELKFEPVPEGVFILSLDITERKQLEAEQRIKYEVLELINTAENWETLLKSLLERLKQWSGCEAVGIRLKEGPDFPYFVTDGFPEQFVQLENHLCTYRENGDIECDNDGNPLLDCMCGNILRGRFDSSRNFFTGDGSFWSNCTTNLLATSTDADRQARTRNRCNGAGYESVALIPLRCGGTTFGLVQLNDRRRERFTAESIALLRRVADCIANYLARIQAEARVEHLNDILRGIRNVNQLITREKDGPQLILKACELLVEARRFKLVILGLTDNRTGKVVSWAGAGRKLTSLKTMLDNGEVPGCARQAMSRGSVVIHETRGSCCADCPVSAEWDYDLATMVIGLGHAGDCYGFLITGLTRGMSDSLEEQDLMREMADDLAFALRSFEIEEERNQSSAALADSQEQLRQAQKLEAIGRLAGGVAHDFNNILMVQMGYCDLISAELRADDPLVEDIGQIKKCADRAASLTRQLLAFSRKQTLQPKVLDLNEVVTAIEKMLRRLIGEDIDFMLTLGNGLGKVMADPGQIEQVIMNLAVNARDAMPLGGKFIIETAHVDLDDAYVRNHIGASYGPHIMLAITDTGCGMDEKTKSRLFEPFFTTKAKGEGTGLGLATVYGIVKQSGGNIWVYSEPGRGTTFKIYLPRVEEATLQELPASGGEKMVDTGEGELILVVEDEPGLRKLFAKMIESLGYRVHLAANGGEAILAVEEQGVKPVLLLTDVIMPGMSGKVLVDRMVRILPDIKVLYMSGYTDNAIVHHGVLDPQTQFIPKPFSKSALAGRIRQVLMG